MRPARFARETGYAEARRAPHRPRTAGRLEGGEDGRDGFADHGGGDAGAGGGRVHGGSGDVNDLLQGRVARSFRANSAAPALCIVQLAASA